MVLSEVLLYGELMKLLAVFNVRLGQATYKEVCGLDCVPFLSSSITLVRIVKKLVKIGVHHQGKLLTS